MSDHKLLKFTRYAKSLKTVPRYVRKRCFKMVDDKKFKEKLSQCNIETIIIACIGTTLYDCVLLFENSFGWVSGEGGGV